MSGYRGCGRYDGPDDLYRDNDSRSGSRDGRNNRDQGRRRSRSPRRDDRDSQRGGYQYSGHSSSGGSGHARGGGQQSEFNRGCYGGDRGGSHGSQSAGSISSSLPPLPNSAPFPEGTGAKVPYAELHPRGTVGRQAVFIANHHSIETLPVIKIYQYDLSFIVPVSEKGSDKATANQMARVLINTSVVEFLGKDFVFDGVSLGWSPEQLIPAGETHSSVISLGKRRDGSSYDVLMEVRNTGVTLNIGILVKYLQDDRMELNPMGNPQLENQLKWLNAVFRADPGRRMVTRPNSNAYFQRSKETSVLLQSTGGVLEALRGIFQTMQVRFNRLTLNVDTATTPFWVPGKSLVDCVCALLGIRSPQDLERHFLDNPGRFFQACGKLLGMYFNVKHLGEVRNVKKIRFQGWSTHDAISTTFDEQAGANNTQSTSVAHYYLRRYQIRLLYPRIPLAHTKDGDFPLELCFSAAGERYRDVLQGAETADFIKFATAPAFIRRQQICENLKTLAWHKLTVPRAHGLSVDPNMMKVKARILPAPKVLYGDRAMVQPREGRWNLRGGLKFLRPSVINSWALICFGSQDGVVDRLATEFIKGFRAVGLSVPSTPPVIVVSYPQDDIMATVTNAISKAETAFGFRPDLILALLQGRSAPFYEAIKNALDVSEGIASQVMVSGKACKDRGQAQYIANVAMKVNAKLAGTNCTIDEEIFKNKRWMLIGGDTSLASPSALRRDPPPPTTVALTGTWDRACTAYTAVRCIQQSTQANLIVNASPMFKELLSRYKEKNNGKLPEKIIYYRDGVSESEFQSIRDHEGGELRRLCQDSGTEIIIIVAIKRHHTRFFAEGELATKLGNVPPGTVIENSSSQNDAFIVAHPDLQGTKRPTRYVVIADSSSSKLSPDDFHRLTYGLCSTYARATTSVAVVPPVYYADQTCERARLHLQDNPDGSQSLAQVHEHLKWNMYWL